MLKPVSWAVAFATRLLFARSVADTGVDPLTGAPAQTINANIWPPHRPRPTFPRQKKKDADRVRMAVIDGRVTFGERTKLVGGTGLRP